MAYIVRIDKNNSAAGGNTHGWQVRWNPNRTGKDYKSRLSGWHNGDRCAGSAPGARCPSTKKAVVRFKTGPALSNRGFNGGLIVWNLCLIGEK